MVCRIEVFNVFFFVVYHLREALRKNTGLFGIYSQIASPPPPFYNPFVQKKWVKYDNFMVI